jgi:DNA-binding NtrC family response regulator
MESSVPVRPRLSLKSLLEAYERELIQEALRSSGGNQRRAARVRGVLPTTLHEKMKRLGLHRRLPPGLEAPAFVV